MKILVYIFRFLLALMFVYSGVEKLFIPYDPLLFAANAAGSDPSFITFYELLHNTGYLYFVGFFQLLCGVLLLFKRTYLLGAIMLVPILLCLLMTHVFFSKNTFYLIFDSSLFLMNILLVLKHWKDLKLVLLKPQSKWI